MICEVSNCEVMVGTSAAGSAAGTAVAEAVKIDGLKGVP